MSVLIKNMEMPKAGNWKTIRVYYDGTCAEPNWQGDCKVMKGCEAVHIPEHGNLIDRDKLILALETQDYSCAPDTLAEWTPMDMTKAEIADLKHAPVVIPAEIRWRSE